MPSGSLRKQGALEKGNHCSWKLIGSSTISSAALSPVKESADLSPTAKIKQNLDSERKRELCFVCVCASVCTCSCAYVSAHMCAQVYVVCVLMCVCVCMY